MYAPYVNWSLIIKMTKSKLELEQRQKLMEIHHKQRKIEDRMSTENLSDAVFKSLDIQWDTLEIRKKQIKGDYLFQ